MTIAGTVGEARAERRRLMAAGRPEAPAAPMIGTIHALAADWFSAGAARWSPGTLALRDLAYRMRIAPTFADTLLGELTRPRVEAWAAALLQAGTGRRAVEIAVQTLRAMLSVALDAGLITVNPAARVRLPAAPPAERTAADRILDRGGAAALLATAVDVRQETILRAALEAGLRRGEIAGLTWPDVKLEERRLIIRQAVWQSKDTGKVVRRPKAGKVGRVAIGEQFAARLADWYARRSSRAGRTRRGGCGPAGTAAR